MSKKTKVLLIVSLIVVAIVLIFCFCIRTKTYTITFDSAGGSKMEQQIVKEGEMVTKPKDPTRDGYLFVEWQYHGKLFDFSTEVEEDLTLKAKWMEVKEDEKLYTVKFNTDGGSTISNQIIKDGEKVKKPNDPTKDGYVFKGWTLDGLDYNFDTLITKNVELVAKWEKVVEQPSQNTPVNKDNSSNHNGSSSNNNQKPSGGNSNTPTKKKYTVTFNSNGGSGVASQTVEEGTRVSQPSNPTRNGYSFTGWTLNGNAYNFNNVVTGNITLVATWKEVIKNNYTVTFNSNGGSSVASQTVVEGTIASQPANPTRSGYRFNGWLLNGSAYNFGSPVTGNITLTANWIQNSYTISISLVDAYSPDRILTVYENGTKINVAAIKYTDGVQLCTGLNTTVAFSDIEGESSFLVVLTDGTQVTATLVI